MRCPRDDGICPEQVERGLLLRISRVGHRAAVASLESAPILRSAMRNTMRRTFKLLSLAAIATAGFSTAERNLELGHLDDGLAGSGNVLAPGAELEP